MWVIDGALTAGECDRVLSAVKAAAERRGGWDKDRHGKYPTTDMPFGDVPEVEPLVRSAVFRRVLCPLTPHYLPPGFLPEHLTFKDCFYVRYSAAAGQQRELSVHTDGSIFSFNILLNDPSDFDGGGTLFEPSGLTAREGKGAAVGHSGQVRHAGVAITRGERYLLVGFIGCATYPYSTDAAPAPAPASDPAAGGALAGVVAAAHDAFCKFGDGAWQRRGAGVVPRMLEDAKQREVREPPDLAHVAASLTCTPPAPATSSPAGGGAQRVEPIEPHTYVVVD